MTNSLALPPVSGTVFIKGLSQAMSLTFALQYSQVKPEIWLRPFVNMALGCYDTERLFVIISLRSHKDYLPPIL